MRDNLVLDPSRHRAGLAVTVYMTDFRSYAATLRRRVPVDLPRRAGLLPQFDVISPMDAVEAIAAGNAPVPSAHRETPELVTHGVDSALLRSIEPSRSLRRLVGGYLDTCPGVAT
jgi:hypothetical protein